MALPFRLYLISDRTRCAGRPLEEVLLAAARAGVRAVQLREKDRPPRERWEWAQRLCEPLRERGAALLVSDRPDIAAAVGAAGVHLPEESVPAWVARRALPPGALVGVSVHGVEAARRAREEGADFLVLGAVFETPHKPARGLEALERVCRAVTLPVLAVGGITPERVRDCLTAGAWGVAVVSAITAAPDVALAVAAFEEALGGL